VRPQAARGQKNAGDIEFLSNQGYSNLLAIATFLNNGSRNADYGQIFHVPNKVAQRYQTFLISTFLQKNSSLAYCKAVQLQYVP
jgi:hypothetical protein